MKLLKHSIKARILFLLASCAALLISTPLDGLYAQKSRDETHSVMRWEHTDDGLKRRFEVRGKAEFNDDYTDVIGVSEGGWVIIEEHRDSQSYRYEVRRDPAGNLMRAFFVNGTARSLDETTRTWLAKIVLDAVRQGGFDAEKRVQRILSKRGVAGVLAEIDQISGDYAKRRYYQELIKQANLDAAALRDVLKQVAAQYLFGLRAGAVADRRRADAHGQRGCDTTVLRRGCHNQIRLRTQSRAEDVVEGRYSEPRSAGPCRIVDERHLFRLRESRRAQTRCRCLSRRSDAPRNLLSNSYELSDRITSVEVC